MNKKFGFDDQEIRKSVITLHKCLVRPRQIFASFFHSSHCAYINLPVIFVNHHTLTRSFESQCNSLSSHIAFTFLSSTVQVRLLVGMRLGTVWKGHPCFISLRLGTCSFTLFATSLLANVNKGGPYKFLMAPPFLVHLA